MFSKSPRSYIKPEDCRRLIKDLKEKGEKNINSYLKRAFDNCEDCNQPTE